MLPSDFSKPTEENERDDNDVNSFFHYNFRYKLWVLCGSEV